MADTPFNQMLAKRDATTKAAVAKQQGAIVKARAAAGNAKKSAGGILDTAKKAFKNMTGMGELEKIKQEVAQGSKK